jgi:hypothetical protein
VYGICIRLGFTATGLCGSQSRRGSKTLTHRVHVPIVMKAHIFSACSVKEPVQLSRVCSFGVCTMYINMLSRKRNLEEVAPLKEWDINEIDYLPTASLCWPAGCSV